MNVQVACENISSANIFLCKTVCDSSLFAFGQKLLPYALTFRLFYQVRVGYVKALWGFPFYSLNVFWRMPCHHIVLYFCTWVKN